MKKTRTRKGMPMATEKLASVGGPWSGKCLAVKFNSMPLSRFEKASPRPKAEKMRATSPCVKHASSSHCVKKGKTVQGAVPGAPWHKISTKVGILKSDQTFGILSLKTTRKPVVLLFSASTSLFGSETKNMMQRPTIALKVATAATLTLHPAMPRMVSAANVVATRQKIVLQTWPVKKSEPKAKPRFVGRLLSANMLSRRGCTMPRPIPLSTRPTKRTSKDHATEQSMRPLDQKSMPRPTSSGLGSSSPTKPQGKAKRAADQPFAVDSKLKEVWSTPKSNWNSVKKMGRIAASMVQATLQRHISENSMYCRLFDRVSTKPSSGSITSSCFSCFGFSSTSSMMAF
mmetsp:Transcript_128622/g.411273  ORF Transcript_128622/g.411273 Transcript_128622/m.411273 type:complete len:344 (-) Transcript_128622:93-1124(-)